MAQTVERNHFYLMTSCDRSLLPYVSVQLVSLSDAMPDAHTEYYLFHRGLPEKDLLPLRALCGALGNVRFCDIVVRDAEKYDQIAALGGKWPGEAFYSLCAHAYLPPSAKRAMYLDAGDTLVIGDISPFYFDPFGDNVLTVHPTRAKSVLQPDGSRRFVPFAEEDLETAFDLICDSPCLFNSGSYVINLEKLRALGLTLDDFVDFSRELQAVSGPRRRNYLYWGDQGFLSAAFVGSLNLYKWDEVSRLPAPLDYTPYDFGMNYYLNQTSHPSTFRPAVIHYMGVAPKPWLVPGDMTVARFAGDPEDAFIEEQLVEKWPLVEPWYWLWFSVARKTDALLSALGF